MNEPLPDLHDAIIDSATLWQLATDLETHAQVFDIRQKGGTQRRAEPGAVELREALLALEQGQVFGVQISYRYDDIDWRDTVMKTTEGLRIVRMQVPVLP